MKIEMMFLPQSKYCSKGVANFNVMMIMMMMIMMMMIMMMVMMMMMMIMMIMTIESVEQRPGLGEHVLMIVLILKMDKNGRIQGIQTIQYTHMHHTVVTLMVVEHTIEQHPMVTKNCGGAP